MTASLVCCLDFCTDLFSSQSLSLDLGSAPKAPTTLVSLSFSRSSVLISQDGWKYFSFFLLFLSSCYCPLKLQNLLHGDFFVFDKKYDLLDRILRSICISMSLAIFCVSLSGSDSGLCIYHLSIWPDFNLLFTSKWIIFSDLVVVSLFFFFILVWVSPICKSYDQHFHLYHPKTYVCYSFVYNQFFFYFFIPVSK